MPLALSTAPAAEFVCVIVVVVVVIVVVGVVVVVVGVGLVMPCYPCLITTRTARPYLFSRCCSHEDDKHAETGAVQLNLLAEAGATTTTTAPVTTLTTEPLQIPNRVADFVKPGYIEVRQAQGPRERDGNKSYCLCLAAPNFSSVSDSPRPLFSSLPVPSAILPESRPGGSLRMTASSLPFERKQLAGSQLASTKTHLLWPQQTS